MPDSQITDYIKIRLQQGITIPTIKAELKSVGWPEQDVQNAFRAANPINEASEPDASTLATPEKTNPTPQQTDSNSNQLANQETHPTSNTEPAAVDKTTEQLPPIGSEETTTPINSEATTKKTNSTPATSASPSSPSPAPSISNQSSPQPEASSPVLTPQQPSASTTTGPTLQSTTPLTYDQTSINQPQPNDPSTVSPPPASQQPTTQSQKPQISFNQSETPAVPSSPNNASTDANQPTTSTSTSQFIPPATPQNPQLSGSSPTSPPNSSPQPMTTSQSDSNVATQAAQITHGNAPTPIIHQSQTLPSQPSAPDITPEVSPSPQPAPPPSPDDSHGTQPSPTPTPDVQARTETPANTQLPRMPKVQQPPDPSKVLPSMEYSSGKTSGTIALILGIAGLLAWIIPVIGIPISLVGLVLAIIAIKASSSSKLALGSLTLNIMVLIAAVANNFGNIYQPTDSPMQLSQLFSFPDGSTLQVQLAPPPATPTSTPTPEPQHPPINSQLLEPEPYSNQQIGFQIKSPLGWQLDQTGAFGTHVVFLNPESDSVQDVEFNANINVVTEPIGDLSIEQYHELSQDNLPALLPDYQSEPVQQIKVDRHQAYLYLGSFTQSGLTLKNAQLLLVDSQTAYVVTATALESTWENHYPSMFNSMITFELISPEDTQETE